MYIRVAYVVPISSRLLWEAAASTLVPRYFELLSLNVQHVQPGRIICGDPDAKFHGREALAGIDSNT